MLLQSGLLERLYLLDSRSKDRGKDDMEYFNIQCGRALAIGMKY